MDNYNELRALFKGALYASLEEDGMELLPEWPVSMPEFVPVLVKLVDQAGKRILTIAEYIEDDFTSVYLIRNTGVDFKQKELYIAYQNVISHIPTIRAIYKMWLVDRLSAEETEHRLAKFKTSSRE